MVFKSTYTSFYLLFSGFCGLCYGFVLLSSATGASGLPQTNTFESGSGWVYDFKTTVLLNEKDEKHKDVGFLISGVLSVEAIWGNSNLERLLKFELKSPQLHIRSRKAPAPDGFVHHTSQLDSVTNTPFLVEWSHGKIQKVLLQKDEPLSLANLKKGIASLFQFQTLDQEINETDSSGNCKVTYTSTSSNSFIKSKSDCSSPDLEYITNSDIILSTKVDSSRTSNYEMDEKNRYIKSVISWETHNMFLTANENIGNKIDAYQSLTLTESKNVDSIEADSCEEALNKFTTSSGIIFTQESLIIEKEGLTSEDSKSFQATVKDYKENLKNNAVGSVLSAKVISKIVGVAKSSNKEDIAKTLGLKKNQVILNQLYDILGYVQTDASHEAAMKKIRFDDPKNEELCERYLWALSISSQTNPDIITNLLKRHQKASNIPEKLKETLILTIAAMAHRLSKLPIYKKNLKVYRNVEETLLNGLDYAKDDQRYGYLRALRNLKSKKTITKLLEITNNGTNQETVLAWKALNAFDVSILPEEVIDNAIKTFFELNKKQDSSARTLALDIIISSKPSDELLRQLLHILISNSKAFEVHQYLIQRLNMIGERDNFFNSRIQQIIKSDYRLNNYGVLAQKGFSTALSRNFLQTPFSNGSLTTVQEIQSGIVKRGIVNVVLEKDNISQEMFSLGIFSGGLSSLISSDSESDPDETATAGIELTVLGTQIRPFVFFNGQGELMGHVWSGTASEKTTAFQALAIVQDHLQYLRLGTGFISVLDLKGSTSFDLSGNVEISLWNRNAFSVVEKTAGIVILGTIQVDTSFVRSQVEFSLSMEPKLNLQTDISFSAGASLCMRLSQPDLIFRHNVFKIERIPGSKHRLRKVKYTKYMLPGRTYSLNKKNTEMCNSVFKQE